MSAARPALAALAAAGWVLAAGCAASARFVVIEPRGGAVAIRRNTPEYREKAAALMAQQCPGGYQIVREEEYVTGQTLTKERSTEYDKVREELRTTEEQRTRRTVEWRISFTCR